MVTWFSSNASRASVASRSVSIELALKEEIREAATCLRHDGATGPDAQADEVDQWLSDTHSIEQLVNRLTKLLGQLKLGPGQQLPAEILDVLRKLHVLDHKRAGFPLLSHEDRTARSARPGAGTARPAAVRHRDRRRGTPRCRDHGAPRSVWRPRPLQRLPG